MSEQSHGVSPGLSFEMLLSEPIGEVAPVPLGRWLQRLATETAELEPASRAVLGGVRAPSASHAVAAGHQAALRQLFPELGLAGIVAFCASEEGGAHPRRIETSLQTTGPERLRLHGKKKWATLSPIADSLLVVCREGVDAGRPKLRVVHLPPDRRGVQVEAMPATDFLPDLRHGIVTFEDVGVEAQEVLPGDGYLIAVKPFRTVEDLLVAAALLGYTLAIGRRFGWGNEAVERHLALIAAVPTLAAAPPDSAAAHVALAGWLEDVRRLRTEQRELWRRVDAPLADAWLRDTSREVAAGARAARRERAWQRLAGPKGPAELPTAISATSEATR